MQQQCNNEKKALTYLQFQIGDALFCCKSKTKKGSNDENTLKSL